MTITATVSDQPVCCDRCIDLGIASGAIIRPGDVFFVLEDQGEGGICCRDCFERLLEQCQEPEA